MSQKNIIILVVTLAVAAILIFVAAYVGLKFIPNAPVTHTATTTTNTTDVIPTTDEKTQILDASPQDPKTIVYTASGFSTKEVTIQITDPIGCLITIENKTTTPLRVGVGPHKASGDPGANYGEIVLGEVGILDVRYPGLPGVSLHDHAKPTNEFHVSYGTGCQ